MQSCVQPRLQSGSLKVTSSAYGGCRSSQLSTAPQEKKKHTEGVEMKWKILPVYAPSAVFVKKGKKDTHAGMLLEMWHFCLLYVVLPSC